MSGVPGGGWEVLNSRGRGSFLASIAGAILSLPIVALFGGRPNVYGRFRN